MREKGTAPVGGWMGWLSIHRIVRSSNVESRTACCRPVYGVVLKARFHCFCFVLFCFCFVFVLLRTKKNKHTRPLLFTFIFSSVVLLHYRSLRCLFVNISFSWSTDSISLWLVKFKCREEVAGERKTKERALKVTVWT